MVWTLHTYDNHALLVSELATRIAAALAAAIHSRGRAALAVSGGSTPRPLFDALAAIDINWSQVVITLVDERWLEEGHADSNALLVREHLLRAHAARAGFVGLMSASPDPFAAAEEVDRRLRAGVLPLDIAVLGMGEDGHTASFFSNASGLERALSPLTEAACCGIQPPAAPYARMTLTLNTLLGAERLLLHIVGEKKWAVLQQAMLPGPVEEMPVRSVLRQSRCPLEIHYAGA